MSVIYLVRHGQGSFGTDNYDRLSTVGREQSLRIGTHFAETEPKIDRIYSGSLNRQLETAALIAEGLAGSSGERLPVTVEPAFEEYDGQSILACYAGSLSADERDQHGWPGLQRDRRRFQLFLERAARAWVEARLESDSVLPFATFRRRIAEALERIMRSEGRGKTLVISTSGGVIGVAVAHVLGLTNHVGIELNWAVHNASITRLIYGDGKVSLSMFNALPHLERTRELITYR